MKRWILLAFALALFSNRAQAHFIWITPHADQSARVIFSEDLEPDAGVPVEKIGSTLLWARDAAGQVHALKTTKGEHAYLATVPNAKGAGATILAGECKYGVLQKGAGKPFLLAYYPKLVLGAGSVEPWDRLALEILPRGQGRFQVLFVGKPAAGIEVVSVPPQEAKEPIKTDAQGVFTYHPADATLFGLRAKLVEARAGEHQGKKFEEVRHYATLVQHAERPAKQGIADRYPPLPRAVSSFGAAVAGGDVYVFGGHVAPTHHYSTEAVLGSFYRLDLAAPKRWQELPAGPPSQGLALVAHAGKIYRVGGMQPRNKEGTKADNRSIKDCACFDPKLGKWEPLPDLPQERSSHDAVVVGDQLIVVGGWKMHGAGAGNDWADSALVLPLNKSTGTWRSVKQPFQRRALTAAVLGEKVYVVGGIAPDGVISLSVDIYDPAHDVWSTGPDLPGPSRNGFAAATCVAGNRLYVSTGDGKVSRLSLKGDAWEEVGRLEQPRIVHRMVAADAHHLIVLGGADKGENIGRIEVIAVPK